MRFAIMFVPSTQSLLNSIAPACWVASEPGMERENALNFGLQMVTRHLGRNEMPVHGDGDEIRTYLYTDIITNELIGELIVVDSYEIFALQKAA